MHAVLLPSSRFFPGLWSRGYGDQRTLGPTWVDPSFQSDEIRPVTSLGMCVSMESRGQPRVFNLRSRPPLYFETSTLSAQKFED